MFASGRAGVAPRPEYAANSVTRKLPTTPTAETHVAKGGGCPVTVLSSSSGEPELASKIADQSANADSDEAGHAFQFEAGHRFRSEAGRHSDLKPATQRSLPRIEGMMFRRGE